MRRLAIHLNLDNDANLCWRAGNGNWTECVTPVRSSSDCFNLDAFAHGAKSMDIASPKTGRAVRLTFSNTVPESALLVVNAEAGDAVLYAYDSSEIPAGDSQTLSVEFKPIEKVNGLPASRLFVKSDKVRLHIEDSEIKIYRKEWGTFVIDTKASDGKAAMLFNTHFQWCIRVDPNYRKLTPDVEYACRFRMRVDKKKEKGEAFWAGVYSRSKSNGIGSISPRVEDVDGEYHWYTAARWVPNPKEDVMIWAGPGRFGDEGSATNAVYIDCVELVPATEVE